MPRKSDRKLFLEAYEREIENELAELDNELEIEVDCMSIDSEIGSDSSLSSLSSLSSISSTSSSSPSSSSLDSSSSSETSDSDDMDIFDDHLPQVLNNRYLYERLEKPKSCDFIKNILPLLPEEDFKQEYRMFRN